MVGLHPYYNASGAFIKDSDTFLSIPTIFYIFTSILAKVFTPTNISASVQTSTLAQTLILTLRPLGIYINEDLQKIIKLILELFIWC